MDSQILAKLKVNQIHITNSNICDRLCFAVMATLSPIPHTLLQCDLAQLSTVEFYSLPFECGLALPIHNQ
jgi:hypothetical protein